MQKKYFLVISICAFCTINVAGQVIKDKKLFTRTLVTIIEHRGNLYDSLLGEEIESWAYKPTIKFPGATESYITGDSRIYVANFIYPDSVKAIAFYKELKEVLNLSASAYGTRAMFRQVYPDVPFFETFHFTDSLMFTNEGSYIQLIGEVPEKNTDGEDEEDYTPDTTKKQVTVSLELRSENKICYYTSGGTRINDNEVNTFISQIAFGKDTALKNIRINQRTQPGKILYDSKIGLKGFTTTITEIRKEKATGINISATKKYFMDENAFLKEVNNMVAKLSSAFPSNYCYEIIQDEDGVMVEFKPVPFMKHPDNVAEVQLKYSAAKGRKNEFVMELYIYRKMHNR